MLSFKDIKLPSNKSFGRLFLIIFLVLAITGYFIQNSFLIIASLSISIIIFISLMINPDLLGPFNKLWMLFGYMLGKIISPIVLGLLFFLVISPVALFCKMFGRDELRLKGSTANSYWVDRRESQTSFTNQF